MTRCAASYIGCQSGKPGNAKVQMVCFPKSEEQCSIWVDKLGRLGWKPSKTSALCVLHFDDSQFEEQLTKAGRKIPIKNPIPTIFESQGPQGKSSPSASVKLQLGISQQQQQRRKFLTNIKCSISIVFHVVNL